MLTMTDGELFSFIDVRVTRYTMLDFEIKHSVVVWEIEGFRVDGFCRSRLFCGKNGSDIRIEHIDVELDGKLIRSDEFFVRLCRGIVFGEGEGDSDWICNAVHLRFGMSRMRSTMSEIIRLDHKTFLEGPCSEIVRQSFVPILLSINLQIKESNVNDVKRDDTRQKTYPTMK
jgi:hypothetical protein